MAEQRTGKKVFATRKPLKWLAWGAGSLAALVLVLFIVSFFLDEPLRRNVEKQMNRHLKGYSVRLQELHFQPIGFSVTLKGLSVIQQAHPDPPVAHFPILHASIHWREILAGRLVADYELDRPQLHINLQQLRTEAAGKVPLKARGWQQAAEAVYPLKINLVTVKEGEIVYIDEDPKRPLHLSRLYLQADNIRNIRSPENVYPSSFHLDTVIFGKGRGVVDGNANFLAEPYPGINARFKLEKVPIDYFKPVIARSNLSIRNGLFFASGEIEYAPQTKSAHVKDLTIQGMEIDYIHTPRTAAAEKRRAAKVAKAAEKAAKTKMQLRLDQLKLSGCTVGMVNESARRPYRVFLADADLLLTNLSNQFAQGPAEARLRGQFMGSGATRVTASFRPEKKGPDLDLHVKIENTRLTDMNELLRAYGNFDVTAGTFSFYSELRIRDRAISGYVKPFFKDMTVYDRRQDREKRAFHQMYEMLVGGVAGLLESRSREEVATRGEVTGQVGKPRISTWQIIGRLVRNAFFKAILPGFEKEVTGARKR